MRIFLGCYCSGKLRDLFIAAGHECISCDLKDTETPGPHYIGDMFGYLESFPDGYFDIGILYPPCTYLCVTANKWLKDQPERKTGALVGEARRIAQKEAEQFFMRCVGLHKKFKIGLGIENPVGRMSTVYRKPDQIITPLQFGHNTPKKTCYWLFGLPKIEATHKRQRGEYMTMKSGKRMATWYVEAWHGTDQSKKSTIRSRNFDGIDLAIVDQWTNKRLLTLF